MVLVYYWVYWSYMHTIKKLTLAFDWKLGNISFIFPSGNNSFNYIETNRYNKTDDTQYINNV